MKGLITLLPIAFVLMGITMLIFFGMGTVSELMGSANTSINASEDHVLAQSFATSTNNTIAGFSIMANIPLLIVVIIVFIVLFAFIGLTFRR